MEVFALPVVSVVFENSAVWCLETTIVETKVGVCDCV